ncbi:MAG: hypothetical protein M1828_003798 [Chrysothrix sp. TS-e1954]|nr:MAG: hypothetical protein M1828_003798 [Chrysothrix sp. TS-e1954]
MSWFRSSEKPQDVSSNPTTGDYKPMQRSERKACWEARDSYFACLDKNSILDALAEKDAAAKKCGSQSQRFETDCASSWITYFKQKRVADFDKEQRLRKLEAEGAVPMRAGGVEEKPVWKFW